MECRQISDLMMKYFDCDIDDKENIILNSHIASCPKCMEEFLALKTALNFVEELPELTLSDDFDMRVMNTIKAQGSKKAQTVTRTFGIGVIGMLIFICYLAFFITIPLLIKSGVMNIAIHYIAAFVGVVVDILLSALMEVLMFMAKFFSIREMFIGNFMYIINFALIAIALNVILIQSFKYQHD